MILPMRILILPSWYPTPDKPVNGIFIREQADALHSLHEVRVLYLDIRPRGEQRAPRRWVSQARGYTEEIIEVPNRPLIWQFTYLGLLLRAYWAMRCQFRPDVLHSHIGVPAGWGAAVLHRLFRVPLVLTENSSEFRSWRKRPGLFWMARIAFNGSDIVIAVSEGLRERIRQTFPHTRRLVIVPNIVDTSRFAPTPFPSTEGGYRLLFVGLLETSQKGLPFLLDALALLRDVGGPPVHLNVAGDGALRCEYEAQVRRLRLDTNVTFHGLQTPAQVAQALGQSHALVLPSLHEALPLVIIEALASGRPVISTRCGGPEFMIDAANGLIVEPGQVAPLATAITDLLAHLERYDPQRLAAAANRHYSYAAVTAELTKVYRTLVAGQKK